MTFSFFLTATRVAALVVAACLAWGACAQDAQPPKMDAADVRSQINAAYLDWGRARLAYDTNVYERMLTPDFYALIDGKRVERKKFIETVSKAQPGVNFLRFDSQILTLVPKGDDWEAVITEKLEAEKKMDDGKIVHFYSFWVTRDGWRKENGKWRACSTEGIGHQGWKDAKPPIMDW